ncbi:MAG: ISKra4 family transposase, partial [Streptosporangiaceae bacterium]
GAKKGLCEALAAEAAAEVARLAGTVAASLAGGKGIEAAELAIRAGLTSLGRGVLEDLLTADAGYRGPRIGCGTGHQAEFVSYRPKTVDTVLGPVTVNRAWYHCATCGHGLAPRDAELGVAGETMSPGLAKMAARAAEAVPFTRGAGLVGALAGIQLTGKRLGRHAEADGRAAAAVIEAEAAAIAARTLVLLPPADLPDKLYVAIDGTGVPMRTAETDGRDGKGDDGKARTREVKLCCAFTQTTVDEDGYPVRDPHSSSYLATFAPAAEFGVLMAAEARRRGAGHVRQLTILGDGAHWIWNLATAKFPEATQIVDLFHAREHLHDLGKLLAFMLGDQHATWVAGRNDELDDGDIEALLSAARTFPLTGAKAEELDTALGYFETNAPRMRYKHFRSLGLFIGSGAVEAGCKAVIGQRLKLSGMHWSCDGATGILTLRCQQASGRWEEIWQQQPNRSGAA